MTHRKEPENVELSGRQSCQDNRVGHIPPTGVALRLRSRTGRLRDGLVERQCTTLGASRFECRLAELLPRRNEGALVLLTLGLGEDEAMGLHLSVEEPEQSGRPLRVPAHGRDYSQPAQAASHRGGRTLAELERQGLSISSFGRRVIAQFNAEDSLQS